MKRIVSILALVLCFGVSQVNAEDPVCQGNVFVDINGGTVIPEFCERIEHLAGLGIVKGETHPDGKIWFMPYREISRAEAAVFLDRYIEWTKNYKTTVVYSQRTITKEDGTREAIAVCPNGLIAIGGGFTGESGLQVHTNTPLPDGSGWRVEANQKEFTASAICAGVLLDK